MVVILWFYINLGIFTIIALEVLLLDYLMAWNLWHTCKRNILPLIVRECSCSLLFITIEGVIEQWLVAPNEDYFKLKPLWLILEVFFQQMLKFIPGCFRACYAFNHPRSVTFRFRAWIMILVIYSIFCRTPNGWSLVIRVRKLSEWSFRSVFSV